MSSKKVLLIVFASNLLLLAGLFGVLYLVDQAYALPLAQPKGERIEITGDWDPNLYPQVPSKMAYQGVLRDSAGSPIDGTHTLTFALQKCSPVCFNVWSESHADVPITNGLFSVVLGETTPLTPSLFTGYTSLDGMFGDIPTVYLTVNVDGEDLTPSPEMVTVPYAFRAEHVNRFPAPDYDSGWQTMLLPAPPVDTCTTFDHDLGGNSDNYVVDLHQRSTLGISPEGVNQRGFGGDHDDIDGDVGVWWSWLDETRIRVCRRADDQYAEEIRIRIWRIE